MQWVVTTGRTVDEARLRALDALGIDDEDLEWEVLDEPRSVLFGLRSTDARVRARVRPTRPRPKIDRRNRRRSSNRSGGRKAQRPAETDDDAGASSRLASTDDGEAEATTPAAPPRTPDATDPEPSPEPRRTPAGGSRGATMSDDIPLAEQQATAEDFLEGLLEAFDADAEVRSVIDDDTLELSVEGDDLGLLVGPRGATLNALQELTRTAVAQQHSGRLEGRLRVDVAGYRARRKEALIRFVAQQAERVKETGAKVALEPMAPPDRKIVHDAVNEIDGVRTASEGEDRNRHVVILPDD